MRQYVLLEAALLTAAAWAESLPRQGMSAPRDRAVIPDEDLSFHFVDNVRQKEQKKWLTEESQYDKNAKPFMGMHEQLMADKRA